MTDHETMARMILDMATTGLPLPCRAIAALGVPVIRLTDEECANLARNYPYTIIQIRQYFDEISREIERLN